MGIRRREQFVIFALVMIIASLCGALDFIREGQERVKAAHQYRKNGEAVHGLANGDIYCEAEEFKVEGEDGWRAKPWGENYYASTFANTFLSRKAYLAAPEQCEKDAVAYIDIEVSRAGRYLVLVRYEAVYRFETQFKLEIRQGDKVLFSRLYGARDNVKIWPFGSRLQKEVVWGWRAKENIVWEGHDAFVNLLAGAYRIYLIAGKQEEPAAKRNVDLILLTENVEGVYKRIMMEGYLPLDGLLTQAGDVWLRVKNENTNAVKIKVPPMTEHSPYWVHLREWKSKNLEVGAGQISEWVEVGSLLDTLNDGQWRISADGDCELEFGLRNARGEINAVRKIKINKGEDLELVALADFRYTPKIRTISECMNELIERMREFKANGRPPHEMLILANWSGGSFPKEIEASFGLNGYYRQGQKGYVDWRDQTPEQLEMKCKSLSDKEREDIFIVSLGDEIRLPKPFGENVNKDFVEFCKKKGLKISDVDPNASNWEEVKYSLDRELRTNNPTLYYWSHRYSYEYGIAQKKQLTDVLRRYLPNAHIGANFAPHHGTYVHAYLREVYQWVTCFREEGMTLPWGEDYIWRVPIGSPQMNGINLDLFRAGNRGKSGRHIFYYVMPHYPGNIPTMWRRLFYNALAHGMTIASLFEFSPVWAAYTENHINGIEMYEVIHKTLYELGLFEDIILKGKRLDGVVGLWFSETADIWGDNEGSFAAAKRALYVALQHTHHHLDFLVEEDALNGILERYKVLYLTDNHLSVKSSKKIERWVRDGGRLFVTAGGGMFDEYNRQNETMMDLFGVRNVKLIASPESDVFFIKEDLPFAKALDKAIWWINGAQHTTDVFGVKGIIEVDKKDVEVFGKYSDNHIALARRKVGKGEVVICGFLPSLSYFKPAIPLKPMGRGSSEDGRSHFLPTDFDRNIFELIKLPLEGITPFVSINEPLVEVGVIMSDNDTLVIFQNWKGEKIKDLRAKINLPLKVKLDTAVLASGNKVVFDDSICVFDLEIADALIIRGGN